MLRRRVWERAGRGAHRFGEVCDDPGIERIGLRQLPGRLGKVTDLARVHHRKGQFAHGEGGHQGALPAARRFEDNQRRLQLAELRETLGDAGVVVGHTPARVLGTAGEVKVVFRDINPYKP